MTFNITSAGVRTSPPNTPFTDAGENPDSNATFLEFAWAGTFPILPFKFQNITLGTLRL